MFNYLVTLYKQFPNWDEQEGIQYRVRAADRRKAIAAARREAVDAGHIDRLSGKLKFYAVKQ